MSDDTNVIIETWMSDDIKCYNLRHGCQMILML